MANITRTFCEYASLIGEEVRGGGGGIKRDERKDICTLILLAVPFKWLKQNQISHLTPVFCKTAMFCKFTDE